MHRQDAPLTGRSVVIVGGGFGGLSTACYLADAGADVEVVEKNEQMGGRASRFEADGFRFDMGPSWYLMPDVFERFFSRFGRSVEEYYSLRQLDPHYRVFYKDGDRVDVVPDRETMLDTFESYEAGAGEALREYLATSETHYEVAMERFVYEDRPRLRDWIDLDVMRAAPIGLTLVGTMDDYVADYFEHPKLQQIMQYTLVFLGGAPGNTPALYNMMSHVDFNMGVFYPDGGIGAVVDAIVELGRELGVTYTTDAEVAEITKRKEGFHVETADGTVRRPDRVVANADYAHVEQHLLPDHERQYDDDYWASKTYSPSAYLLYLGVEGDIDPLEHHSLVLPTEWEGHFERVFSKPDWPENPAYYVCAPSVTDESVAPEGHSNLFVLVPVAPGLEDSEELREEYRGFILADLAEHTGVDVRDRIVLERQFCVADFADRYNAYRGNALGGLAHTLRQTALLRPGHRSSAVDGLYFTGGYTTPGIGVPMCLISGEHAASALIEDE